MQLPESSICIACFLKWFCDSYGHNETKLAFFVKLKIEKNSEYNLKLSLIIIKRATILMFWFGVSLSKFWGVPIGIINFNADFLVCY